jgi:hypothetical protein
MNATFAEAHGGWGPGVDRFDRRPVLNLFPTWPTRPTWADLANKEQVAELQPLLLLLFDQTSCSEMHPKHGPLLVHVEGEFQLQ